MIEKDYESNRSLVRAIAFQTFMVTGFDLQELHSKANELFVEAWYSFDPDQFPDTQLSTWIYTQVKQRLRNYVFRRDPACMDENWSGDWLLSRHPEWHPRRRLELKEALDDMSDEAKFVIEIILEGPAELLDLDGTETPKTIRGALYRYLRESGWAWSLIWKTFREIKETVARM